MSIMARDIIIPDPVVSSVRFRSGRETNLEYDARIFPACASAVDAKFARCEMEDLVSKKVYALWFVREGDQSEDIELLIGIYATEDRAKAAIERLKSKPGFSDFFEGFSIDPCVLDQDSWVDGFFEESGDPSPPVS
jgi:hypothetical protein